MQWKTSFSHWRLQWHWRVTEHRCGIVILQERQKGQKKTEERRERKMKEEEERWWNWRLVFCVDKTAGALMIADTSQVKGQSEWRLAALTDSRRWTEKCCCGTEITDSARTGCRLLPLITFNYSSQRWIKSELHNRGPADEIFKEPPLQWPGLCTEGQTQC